MSNMIDTPMLAALESLRGTGGEYHGFLSNHAPMAVDALIRLGGAAHVERWVELYRVDLEPAPPRLGSGPSEHDWTRHLGVAALESDWTRYFEEAIAGEGWNQVVSVWWPRLLPGAAASASHGLIRTAHAIRNMAEGLEGESAAASELAAGLALWASRYQELPGHPGLVGELDVASAFAGLPRLDPTAPSRGPGLTGRLMALEGVDGFASALDQWGASGPVDRALDELIAQAARIVVAREDAPIVYCHALTAPAAVRMVLPHIPAEHRRATLAGCWQLTAALVAAFAVQPDPRAAAPSAVGTLDPRGLASAAIEHGDEHVLKLTEACIRQFQLTGDEALLAAAEAFRHRIPPFW
jgi:hypothetical protein